MLNKAENLPSKIVLQIGSRKYEKVFRWRRLDEARQKQKRPKSQHFLKTPHLFYLSPPIYHAPNFLTIDFSSPALRL